MALGALWSFVLGGCLGIVFLVLKKIGLFGKAAVAGNKRESSRAENHPTQQQQPPERHALLVVVGTQTGTTTIYAKALLREACQLKIPAKMRDMEDCSPEDLKLEKLVIFMSSTFGDGDPPDGAKALYDWIIEQSPGSDFAGMNYAVFGLGDKQYKHFCECGKKLDTKLQALGAQRICEAGLGDTPTIEEDFDSWRQSLWPAVGKVLSMSISADREDPCLPECSLRYVETPAAANPYPIVSKSLMPRDQKQPALVPLVHKQELLKDSSSRSTLLIHFDISQTCITYQSGDHLGILPCNADSIVDEYMQRLEISKETGDRVIALLDNRMQRSMFPTRVSVRTVLKWFVDLAGPPRKATLRALAHYCENPKEKEQFLALLRSSSLAKYQATIAKARTVVGVLKIFPSCRIPIGHFLELMPRVRPRYYSVSTDQLMHPTVIGITVAVVSDGLCTKMLSQSAIGDKAFIFVRKSTFHLPARAKNRPVILIGPGTGIAPLVGFLYRRIAWKEKGFELGNCIFFFGCRKSSEDYIYSDLLNECVQSKVITKLCVAFSRETSKKHYVQHDILKEGAAIWAFLKEGANMYICGDAKGMSKDVNETLLQIAVSHGGLSRDAAVAYFDKLAKENRFLEDVWSA